MGLDWVRATYYLRIAADRIRIRDLRSGHVLDEPAAAAIETAGGRMRVLAVGQEALGMQGRSGIELRWPFAHPRVPVGDFTVGEVVLAGLVRRFVKGIPGWLRPATRVLVHPVRMMEGGLTQIELRAFEELVHNVGARRLVVHEGGELADHEIDAAFKKLGN